MWEEGAVGREEWGVGWGEKGGRGGRELGRMEVGWEERERLGGGGGGGRGDGTD